MKTIILYDGRTCQIDNCIGCDVYDGRIDVSSSIIDENELFRVIQDTENPIPGLIVISPKRHIRTFYELNKKEQKELCNLIIKTRKGMNEILGISKVTLIQEDGPQNMHFHPWFFPWHQWMNEIPIDNSNTDTEKIRKIMEFSRENLRRIENIEKIHNTVKKMRIVYES